MKLLLDIIAPGVENLHGHEPTLESEIAAYVKALVKSRTRGPEPRVVVVCLGTDDVCVNANELLRLQSRETVLRWIQQSVGTDPSGAFYLLGGATVALIEALPQLDEDRTNPPHVVSTVLEEIQKFMEVQREL